MPSRLTAAARRHFAGLPGFRAAYDWLDDARHQRGAIATARLAAQNAGPDPRRFRCNVCSTDHTMPPAQFGREIASCPTCGSTERLRAVVHLLSIGLYGRSMPLPEFPADKAIAGAGLSDWRGYARPLARKFRYRNTHFHRWPRLDITAPPAAMLGTLDFLIATEVFEHVLPPVARAFDGAFRLLKPGGHLILTVPYRAGAATTEHYPDLQDFAVIERDGRLCVAVTNRDGTARLDANPVFHGGRGHTLEMRVFGELDLIAALRTAGFGDIRVWSEAEPAFGLDFSDGWSLPILARKPSVIQAVK